MEGPSFCLMFLGIEVDTINQQLHLTEEKLDHLLAELKVTRGLENRVQEGATKPYWSIATCVN